VAQITYETAVGDDHILWRIDASPGAAPESLSTVLDPVAPYPGNDFGPISVSPDGAWYVFQSERFDAAAQGDANSSATRRKETPPAGSSAPAN
jgi:hypothetical protein